MTRKIIRQILAGVMFPFVLFIAVMKTLFLLISFIVFFVVMGWVESVSEAGKGKSDEKK